MLVNNAPVAHFLMTVLALILSALLISTLRGKEKVY
jgi:hypothetical protein